MDAESETLIPTTGGAFDVAGTLKANNGGGGFGSDPSETFIIHSLRADGFDASEDGTGRGTPLVPIAFGWQNSSQQGASASASNTPTLDKSKVPAVMVEYYTHDYCHDRIYSQDGVAPAPNRSQNTNFRIGMQVRRLTPRECERLQGFPDDYTLIPYRSKPAADGPRYKALGNSMAVPVMHWIGRRITAIAAIQREGEGK
jgi:DNA (cytosine-5)-methyltransferase 1